MKKEKVSLEHTLQRVVIITHLTLKYYPLKTCRTFGLIQIMRPISSHQQLREKPLVICNDQKAVLMTGLKQSGYSLPLAKLVERCRKDSMTGRQVSTKCGAEISVW